MSQTQHTPRPWFQEGAKIKAETQAGPIRVICTLPHAGQDRPLSAEEAANANLIVAAPDLLTYAECDEACAELVRPKVSEADTNDKAWATLERHGFKRNGVESPQQFASRLRRAAIARAEGRA